MTTKPATILASEVRMMKSKHTGRKYRLTISLPHAYTKAPNASWPFDNAPAKWPVVYLLDANWYFGMVTDIVRSTSWCGTTTDAIVVGIGYPENADPQDSWRVAAGRRVNDYDPVRDENTEKNITQLSRRPAPTGDSERFLQFIKYELIPLIESEYRAEPSRRILAGHSASGLFTVYAMIKEPGLFRSYVAGSPALAYGERFVFGLEAAFAKKHKRLAAQLYMGVGELEEYPDDTMLTSVYRFAVQLQSRNYKGLSVTKQVFPANNHCEVIAPAFQAGLRIALSK